MGLFGSKTKFIASPEERTVAQYAAQDALKPPMSSELNKRLQLAVEKNWPLLTKDTLEKGATPELHWTGRYYEDRDNGRPLLSIAVRGAQEENVKLFLQFGANPNRELSYDTYMGQAVLIGNSRMVRMLLDAGADPNGHGRDQRWQDWPYEMAKRNCYTDIMRMIEQEPARRAGLAAVAAMKKQAAEEAAKQAVLEQERAETAAEVTKRITVNKPLTLKGVKAPAAESSSKKGGWRKLLG